MTICPQVEGMQDCDVIGAAGVGVADVDDIDIPPPQALKITGSKAHAAGCQRRTLARAWVA
jgi:hypothetical protein